MRTAALEYGASWGCTMWGFWLAACAAPEIASVTPAAGLPGDPIEIRGARFGPSATIFLSYGEDVIPISGARIEDDRITAEIPPLPPGHWTLSVSQFGGAARWPEGLEILAGP